MHLVPHRVVHLHVVGCTVDDFWLFHLQLNHLQLVDECDEEEMNAFQLPYHWQLAVGRRVVILLEDDGRQGL